MIDQVESGICERNASVFTNPGALQEQDGFNKFKVMATQNLKDYDELNVIMYWDNLGHFQAWRNSGHFKEAYKRSNGLKEDSPILGSEIIIAEVASVLEAAVKKSSSAGFVLLGGAFKTFFLIGCKSSIMA